MHVLQRIVKTDVTYVTTHLLVPTVTHVNGTHVNGTPLPLKSTYSRSAKRALDSHTVSSKKSKIQKTTTSLDSVLQLVTCTVLTRAHTLSTPKNKCISLGT